MRNLALIPARGGSKRIPNKNRLPFCGVPAIQRVIEVAIRSEIFDGIVVTTDDEAIAKLAIDAGAEVPFLRPAALSDDFTSTRLVVQHAIDELESQGNVFENICCLYPLAVFMKETDLRATYKLLRTHFDKKFVAVVTDYGHPINRSLTMDENNYLVPTQSESIAERTQDLRNYYHDAGQLYWGTSELWRRGVEVLENSVGYEIPRWRVQDIDSKEDWKRAELLFELLEKYDSDT